MYPLLSLYCFTCAIGPSHPEGELGYILNDAGASILISHGDYKQKAQRLSSELGIDLRVLEHPLLLSNQVLLPALLVINDGDVGGYGH